MRKQYLNYKLPILILLAMLVYILILLRPEILILLIILLLLLGLYFQITPDTIKRIIRWLEGESRGNVETEVEQSSDSSYPRGRVMVLIDAENIQITAIKLGLWIDYALLKEQLSWEASEVVGLLYYSAKANHRDNERFHEALEHKGYKIMPNDLKLRNLDADILYKLFELGSAEEIDSFDTVVILSGDGNAFCRPTVKLREAGKRVEIYSFACNTHRTLREKADFFQDLRDLKRVCRRVTSLPKSKKKPLPKLAIKTPKIVPSRVINLKKAKQVKDSKSSRHNPRRKRLG